MMKHPFLYTARIMIQGPLGGPTEIFRSNKPFTNFEWLFWTRDLDRSWDVWAEQHTPEKWTLGAKRLIPRTVKLAFAGSQMLAPEENAALEDRGLVPEFKVPA